MKKLKIYGSLLLSFLSAFMLGAYTDATVYGFKEINPHQWVLTSFFGLMFLGIFLNEYKS